MSLIPVDFFDWGYWDKQRSLFPSFEREFDSSFEEFDRELEIMKDEMHKLAPKEFQEDHFLDISDPYVEDAAGNKKLHLKFDCSDFKPEEISVKTEDMNLVVHAKHEEGSKGHKVYKESSSETHGRWPTVGFRRWQGVYKDLSTSWGGRPPDSPVNADQWRRAVCGSPRT